MCLEKKVWDIEWGNSVRRMPNRERRKKTREEDRGIFKLTFFLCESLLSFKRGWIDWWKKERREIAPFSFGKWRRNMCYLKWLLKKKESSMKNVCIYLNFICFGFIDMKWGRIRQIKKVWENVGIVIRSLTFSFFFPSLGSSCGANETEPRRYWLS